MKILALDTSTEACSAALSLDGEITELYELAPQRQSQLILGMLETLLKQTNLSLPQLDALAFGRGPGSFTGVRMATSITQALAFAHDLPVIPVSTLQALAQGTQASAVLACIDARMNELYYAAFELVDGYMQALTPEMLCTKDTLIIPEGNYTWHKAEGYPRARDIAFLATKNQAVTVDEIAPVYLRDQVAWQPSTH